ncbi:response regulator [Simkania negevensis]|uniref:Response regulator n=1 Tax=Simkania negevensis TaxID=83561 RepID=A0ABS3ARN2_9BACT|nr:response regulator [Simkania negevensis]
MREKKKKILVAMVTGQFSKKLVDQLQHAGFDVKIVDDGEKCLALVETFLADLIILDFTLLKLNGLDILRLLKKGRKGTRVGVFVCTEHALYQDYQLAIENGANYYFLKSYAITDLIDTIHSYFQGSLVPSSFIDVMESISSKKEGLYLPEGPVDNGFIRFWGTRGSVPVAGPDYLRYGGNTSSLEVRNNDDLVIIDAGTGIRPLGNILMNEASRTLHLFIGHTHWDHILGFPFFKPAYSSEFEINIYGPQGCEKGLYEVFTGMLDKDYFPVKLDEMMARLHFHELLGDPVTIGNITIEYIYTSHPGPTLGFKLISPDRTIIYVTDNEFLVGYHGHPNKIHKNSPLLVPYEGFIDFCKGADFIVHEAQYFPEDYLKKVGWGHSSISNVTVLLKHTGIKRWVVTHHDPDHGDAALLRKLILHKQILAEAFVDTEVLFASDGCVHPF